MSARPRLGISLVLICLLGAAIAFAVPDTRTFLLRRAGWTLVVNDPEQAADIIVIAVDADGAGVLEAADLVHRGVAARVAVFADPPDSVDREFVKRGVAYFNAATVSIQQLKALGVSAVERIPPSVTGTDDEGQVLPVWCDQNGFRTVVLVSTSDHSRRVRRVLNRAMAGHQTRVLVRYSSYSQFDPDAWWLTRDGVRIEVIELEKLLVDFLRHPLA